MRHGKKINHLGRKSAHRKLMLANMATSLIMHKRITTTVAKAKALKKYVEPLITKAKEDTTHSRRTVFSELQHKEPVKELFGVVADKVADRPGGYTRILKTGNRLGDNAETCIIELVDFNETYILKDTRKGGKKRTRRGGAKTTEAAEATPAQPKSKAPKAEKKAVEAVAVPEVAEAEVIEEETAVAETEVLAEAEVVADIKVEEEVEEAQIVTDEAETTSEEPETTETEEENKDK